MHNNDSVVEGLYNDGNVHLDFFKKSDKDKEKIADEFSEGNEYLKGALLSLWNSNIRTISCCAGHYQKVELPGYPTISRFPVSQPYLSIILDEKNYQKIGSLCSKLSERFKDKINIRYLFHPLKFVVVDINFEYKYIRESNDIVNDVFKFIFKCLKQDLLEYSDDYSKFAFLFGSSSTMQKNSFQDKDDIKRKESVIISIQSKDESNKYSNISFSFLDVEEVFLEIVKQDGLLLKFINPNCSNYFNIVLEAVKQNPKALQFVDSKIGNYKKIVFAALNNDISAVKYIADDQANKPSVKLGYIAYTSIKRLKKIKLKINKKFTDLINQHAKSVNK